MIIKTNRLLIPILLVVAAAVVLAACSPGRVSGPAATPTGASQPEAPPTEMPATAMPSPTAETAEAPAAEAEAPEAAQSARQALAQQIQADLADIAIVSAEPVEWPDSCLGVQTQGVMCLQVITPGYRVVLEAEGEQYVFHTDQEGRSVVRAGGPASALEDAVIEWSRTVEGMCQAATIAGNGVAFGPCDEPATAGELAFAERAEDLAYFVNQFASFEAETPAGTVAFSGQGDVTASPAEQRMIAEWAQLAAMEAAAGRSGASWGLIFAWHREGGIAGFCEDVAVYVTGVAYATSCAGNEPQDLGRVRLDADQLAAAFNWVDTLQPFEYEHKDPATADAMTIRIVFTGAGSAEATEQERQAIETLATDVLAQAQK